MNQLKQTPLPLRIVFILACFAVLPGAQALLPPPPPDGGYPNHNTAEGDYALYDLTSGAENTAVGHDALTFLTSGSYNTAVGSFALGNNTTGSSNTAVGGSALGNTTSGNFNTANGFVALLLNTTGNQNTATGASALYNNTSGNNNTADGVNALLVNTTGMQNTATGVGVLRNNTTANNNTANGFQALFYNITGGGNTAIGVHALFNNKGSSNIGLGLNAGVNLSVGSNNIDIGSGGVAGESNTIRIGSVQTRAFIKGISGVAIAGAPVVVNAGGQLGVAASSERFKTEIKPMDRRSEAILSLKPVTFRYKKEIDADRTPQFGLVAEDVEKVNPDLVMRDREGRAYTVCYEAVNAMLLNEFLKEHQKVEEQQATIGQLKSNAARQEAMMNGLNKTVEVLTTQLKEQAAQIQKVSAQVETHEHTTRIVAER